MPEGDKKDDKKEKKKKIPELTPDGKPWPSGPDGKPLEVGPDGKPVPAVPLTEIQQVQLNIDKATDESLESTRRMVQMMEESKDMGIKTLVMLDEQGEQLERIEEGADKINKEMQEAEKNLAGMEACCGLCVLPWNKAKGIEDDEEYKQTWNKNDGGTKLAADGPRRVVGDAGPAGKGYVLRITNDAREDEMDENLVQVSAMIGNLRNMAIDMNNGLEEQNSLIARVEKKTEFNTKRVDGANKRTAKLLK